MLYRKTFFLLFAIAMFAAAAIGQVPKPTEVTDHHVHIMSPRMIKLFKDVNIPFSRPDAEYSDIDVVARRLGTKRMSLLSMAYLYGYPEFGRVENEYGAVIAENNYVVAAKKKIGRSARAFCGIDPLKSYALGEARRCRAIRADGLKIHANASQLYLTVPAQLEKIRALFAYAASAKMPVVFHFDNSHRRFGEPDVKLFVDEILKKVAPVKVQIAHLGSSGGFGPRTKAFLDAFLTAFEQYPELGKHEIRFDISAAALDKDSEGVRKLTDQEFADVAYYVRKLGTRRIVFGTDYPLYEVKPYLEILRNRVKLTDGEIRRIATQ